MNYKIITAVATEPVALSEARLQLRLPDIVTEEDSLITAWITAAREAAEHYTGRALAAQTLEAVLDEFPGDDEAIDLPMPPVASVTSIKYDDEDGVEQTLATSKYALSTYGDSRRINLTYDSEWPDTRDQPNAVRIRFVTGYTKPPAAVKSAILLMVAWMHENRGNEMGADDIQPLAAKALLGLVKLWGC